MHVFGIVMAVLCLSSTDAFAFARGLTEIQDPSPNDGKGRHRRVIVFGDSIGAGFNSQNKFSTGLPGGSMYERAVEYYSLNHSSGATVFNLALPGASSHRIIEHFKRDVVRSELIDGKFDFVGLNAGGNDFLSARGVAWCNPAGMREIVDLFKYSFPELVRQARAFVDEDRRVIIQNIYLPEIGRMKAETCPDGRPQYDHVIDYFFEVNQTIFREAMRAGATFIDTFGILNCAAFGDTRCNISADGALSDYIARVKDAFARNILVEIGTRTNQQGRPMGLLQLDNRHPSDLGHAFVGMAIFEKIEAILNGS